MNLLEGFARSYAGLEAFLNTWMGFLNERCENSDEDCVKASYYIWTRYTMSMGTVHRLSAVQYLPDLYVIGRGCLEFSASLKGVMADIQLAHDYLEFEKHAKTGILRFLAGDGELEKAKIMKEHLDAMGIDNIEEYRWDKWCARVGGITGVMKKYSKPRDLRLYRLLSHFAHGSILSLQILKNMALLSDLWAGVRE